MAAEIRDALERQMAGGQWYTNGVAHGGPPAALLGRRSGGCGQSVGGLWTIRRSFHCSPNSRQALSVVAAATMSKVVSLISAIFCATRLMYALSLRRPRYGTGAR